MPETYDVRDLIQVAGSPTLAGVPADSSHCSAVVSSGNEPGTPELNLATVQNSANLILSDRNAKPRAILSTVNGNPSLTFVDENGDPRFKAP